MKTVRTTLAGVAQLERRSITESFQIGAHT